MIVREKQDIDLSQRHVLLPQADRNAPSCVDNQLLAADLYQGARTEPVGARDRGTGAEQCNPELVFGTSCTTCEQPEHQQ
jgi:hypothetical protein